MGTATFGFHIKLVMLPDIGRSLISGVETIGCKAVRVAADGNRHQMQYAVDGDMGVQSLQ